MVSIRKYSKVLILLPTVLMAIVTPIYAIPVEDFGEWMRTIQVLHQLDTQYQTMKQQYQTIQQSYGQLKQQYQSITGNYGWGAYQNSLSDLQKQREWAASDWKSALQGMSGGNPQRYQQLLQQYKQAHTTLSQQQFEKGTDKGLALSYHNQVQTNQASATSATYEFNDINTHLKTLYQLGQQIENAEKNKDLKSAVDLNSRIELEVAYISVEELRMQTLLNEQTASLQAARISIENEKSQFNQAGEQQ